MNFEKTKSQIEERMGKKLLSLLFIFVILVVSFFLYNYFVGKKNEAGKPISAEAYRKRVAQLEIILAESPSFARLVDRYPGSKDFILSLNNSDFENCCSNIQPFKDFSEFLDYLCEHPEIVEMLSKAKNPLDELGNLCLQFYKGYYTDQGF